MTYAVAMKTITDFERALGRRITWSWPSPAAGDHGDKLRLVPHAEDAGLNAYYVDGEIRYGYGKPSGSSSMPPDQVVYTCLSYDIVAHQTLHALHAALLPGYFENADIGDGMAFLEGHDDIVTILQHFAFPDALLAVVTATRGRLNDLELPGVQPDQGFVRGDMVRPNPLLGIAPQMAAAVGFGAGHGIRDSVFTPADTKALDGMEEVHARGAVLAGAFLDAFFTAYRRRSEDLFAIGGTRDGELNPDLAGRLAAEAAKTAGRFLEMAIRSLDYCPPDGIDLGDFLRAVVTADAVRVPNDRWRYREALIDAFRDRGIYPQGVHSYSDEGLRWPDVAPGEAPPPGCAGLDLWADEKAIRARLEPWVVEHRDALGLPGRGAVAVEALTTRVTRPVTGDRPEREVVVRLRGGTAPRGRRSTVVLDSKGNLRHVIARARHGARGRRGASPEPTLSAILPDARRRSSASPFDRRRHPDPRLRPRARACHGELPQRHGPDGVAQGRPGRQAAGGGRLRRVERPVLPSARPRRAVDPAGGRARAERRGPAIPSADGVRRGRDDDRTVRVHARSRDRLAVGETRRRRHLSDPAASCIPTRCRRRMRTTAASCGASPSDTSAPATTRSATGSSTPACHTTSSSTRRRTRSSTASASTSSSRPARTRRPSTRRSPMSSRCCSTSASRTRCWPRFGGLAARSTDSGCLPRRRPDRKGHGSRPSSGRRTRSSTWRRSSAKRSGGGARSGRRWGRPRTTGRSSRPGRLTTAAPSSSPRSSTGSSASTPGRRPICSGWRGRPARSVAPATCARRWPSGSPARRRMPPPSSPRSASGHSTTARRWISSSATSSAPW